MKERCSAKPMLSFSSKSFSNFSTVLRSQTFTFLTHIAVSRYTRHIKYFWQCKWHRVLQCRWHKVTTVNNCYMVCFWINFLLCNWCCKYSLRPLCFYMSVICYALCFFARDLWQGVFSHVGTLSTVYCSKASCSCVSLHLIIHIYNWLPKVIAIFF